MAVHALPQPSTSIERKIDKMFFAGTTTGDLDPTRNVRVAMCLWSARRRHDILECYISRVTQMDPDRLLQHVRRIQCNPPFAKRTYAWDEFAKYRFALNLPGNTCAWSRLPEIMASRTTVMMHYRHPDMCWYYPAMQEGTHYVGFSSEFELEHAYRSLSRDARRCEFMTEAAHAFARSFVSSASAGLYTAALLEEAAHLFAP